MRETQDKDQLLVLDYRGEVMAEKEAEIRPDYYKVKVRAYDESGKPLGNVVVECFDLIFALGLNFWSGNALKYLFRAGKKSKTDATSTDLRKASTYCLEAARRDDEDLPF